MRSAEAQVKTALMLVRLRHCIIGVTQANQNETLELAPSIPITKRIPSRLRILPLNNSTNGGLATEKAAMSSEKVDYSRRTIMLKAAAEAPAVRASQTDKLENSSWTSKTAFFSNFPAFSDDGRPWKDDDQEMDLMALVVLDDFPSEVCMPCKLNIWSRHLMLSDHRLSTTSFASTQKPAVSLTFGLLTRTTLSRIGILHAQQKEPPFL